jgi:hypothetical protein
MAAEVFSFKPADIPQAVRGRKKSRYSATVESVYEYMKEHPDQKSVKLELVGVSAKAAAASFRQAISKSYPSELRLVQRGEDLYLQRR